MTNASKSITYCDVKRFDVSFFWHKKRLVLPERVFQANTILQCLLTPSFFFFFTCTVLFRHFISWNKMIFLIHKHKYYEIIVSNFYLFMIKSLWQHDNIFGKNYKTLILSCIFTFFGAQWYMYTIQFLHCIKIRLLSLNHNHG